VPTRCQGVGGAARAADVEARGVEDAEDDARDAVGEFTLWMSRSWCGGAFDVEDAVVAALVGDWRLIFGGDACTHVAKGVQEVLGDREEATG